MRLLRLVFGLNTIYFKQTAQQILYFYGLLAVSLVVLTQFFESQLPTTYFVLLVVYAIVVFLCLRSVVRTLIVNAYLRKYKAVMPVAPSAELARSSVNIELNDVDQLKPIASYGDQNLSLATFNFYQKTKNGEYLAKQAYYLVLETPLKRILPHIVFDSKIAKRRQFRHIFLKVQRISVQGPFDDVFDTYVPKTYAIDSLSFVSPEVMQVLLDARAYDIEIINDKLLLYAPLIDESDIAAMRAKARVIARELNDNIDTYRDDRLKGLERETNVTPFARSLLRSPFKNLVLVGLLGAATLGIIMWACLQPSEAKDILFNQLSVVVYASLAGNAWTAGKIVAANKRALAGFNILYRTNRGRPIVPTIPVTPAQRTRRQA